MIVTGMINNFWKEKTSVILTGEDGTCLHLWLEELIDIIVRHIWLVSGKKIIT